MSEIARGHLDQVGVVQQAQHLQLVLGVVPSHLKGEELGCVHLPGRLVKTLVDGPETATGVGKRSSKKKNSVGK